MNTIERVMRVMTHVSIGAAMGMVAWIAWSGILIVSGEVRVLQEPWRDYAMLALPQRQPVQLPCCFVPVELGPAERPLLGTVSGGHTFFALTDTGVRP